jgi:trimethylamine--corrinoid protein Co-methyltransferase
MTVTDRSGRRTARRRPAAAIVAPRLPMLRHPRPPYDWLEPPALEEIHRASLEILEDVGVDFWDDEALEIWATAGATVDRDRRHVWIDRGLVEAALAAAPASFTWRARNPQRDVFIGENAIAFGPNGGMVFAQDLAGGRRPGTMADLTDFMKLSQLCDVLHFACWEQVAPQDIPVNVRHLQRMEAGLTLTDKPVMEAAHGRIIPTDCLEMARIAFGGTLPAEPVIGDVINVNSPLRFDDRMLGGLISYARAGQATFITPFILAGAMSPITMAAALAQQNAEALAGITLTQLVRPGAPVIYGGFTTNADMRSGSPAFGTPEGAWAVLAGAQLARRYGLPYRASGGLTNAKVVDAQAAYESQWTLWPAVMGHSNLIMHAVGWLDGGLTASFEKFIIDAENLAMFAHFLADFAVTDATLALDAIREVGPGGHHFGTAHTEARFRTEHYQSALADRQAYATWQESGGLDAEQRAYALYRQLLAEYVPPPLDDAIRAELADYVARRTRDLAGVRLYD